jgi:hypothetical protein
MAAIFKDSGLHFGSRSCSKDAQFRFNASLTSRLPIVVPLQDGLVRRFIIFWISAADDTRSDQG